MFATARETAGFEIMVRINVKTSLITSSEPYNYQYMYSDLGPINPFA